ncbi:hypothetical protein Ancab_013902 [Ancistrocladus abbreviatus]
MDGCYLIDEINYSFELTCENNSKTMLGTDFEVLNITLDGRIYLKTFIAYACYNESGNRTGNSPRLWMKKFTISSSDNKFMAIGCDTKAIIEGARHGTRYYTGCSTYCYEPQDVIYQTCSGVGCCETIIPDGVTNVNISLGSYYRHEDVHSFNPCSAAFIVANGEFTFSPALLNTTLEQYEQSLQFPVVFNWTIGQETCESAIGNGTCLCGEKWNSTCYDPEKELGYRCKCLSGFDGNPYLPGGCQGTTKN